MPILGDIDKQKCWHCPFPCWHCQPNFLLLTASMTIPFESLHTSVSQCEQIYILWYICSIQMFTITYFHFPWMYSICSDYLSSVSIIHRWVWYLFAGNVHHKLLLFPKYSQITFEDISPLCFIHVWLSDIFFSTNFPNKKF